MKHSKRLLSSLFYVPKYEKVSEKAFLRIMLSSIFGILICGICLAGLTWAWFSSAVTSTANNITAADFSVAIIYKNDSNEAINPFDESGTLKSGTYKVTLTASGTASTGYCKVEFDGKPYYTVPLFTDAQNDTNSVIFTVYASEGSTLTITHQWGTCAVAATDENPHIGNQANAEKHIVNSIGTPSVVMTAAEASEQSAEGETANALTDTEQTYAVQQGDTLSEIASRYGTTAAVLSAYNNIENAAEIQTGATLKIPPANVAEEIADSETQSMPDTDTTVAGTDEP